MQWAGQARVVVSGGRVPLLVFRGGGVLELGVDALRTKQNAMLGSVKTTQRVAQHSTTLAT